MSQDRAIPTKFRAYTPAQFKDTKYWKHLDQNYHKTFENTVEVLPFRVNDYVLENLIDWSQWQDDPMFKLLFPQKGMLTQEQFHKINTARAAGNKSLTEAVKDIRSALNPHPASQTTQNIPLLNGEYLDGVQHKYEQTALLFPCAGQSCHAYCSFCFRWPQFISDPSLKIQAKEADRLADYLKTHPEISDILITGGDPMIMKAKALARYLTPLLEIPTVKNIRIGSKSLTYWPNRFTTDRDAGQMLHLFEKIVNSGRHLSFMAHLNHWRELMPQPVEKAIQAVCSTGAIIRTQGPLLRHINNSPDIWERLWEESVKLNMIPYYMFVERDTGPSAYFRIPLAEAHEIYRRAYQRVSGLARSARGPVMSTKAGKIQVEGVLEQKGEKMFILKMLQARESNLTQTPFAAKYSDSAAWIDELQPYDNAPFPFEKTEPFQAAC
ncbi:MAG: hypothetical protein OQJ97_03885 [Rhodospirillales bacterium]|nr:hypothetical protein [Rhodospirillales bacterium]